VLGSDTDSNARRSLRVRKRPQRYSPDLYITSNATPKRVKKIYEQMNQEGKEEN